MPKSSPIELRLTSRELDFLGDLLEKESYRMESARKPGAGPGRKEKLLNSIIEKATHAAATASR